MTDLLDPTLAALARRFEKPLIESDPVSWAKRALDIDLWSKQREILRLLEFVPKLAVPSCHDAGKSFIASLAAARFLAKYPPGTARVVSTAPTSSQVRSILWNEINALHTRSQDSDMPLPGRVTQTEWWIGNYQAGLGRKPSDYAPGTFSGLHAEHILIIIDEAGAIPNELWTGVDTLATNAGAVILAIGNPDDPQAEFKNVCENAPDNGWTMVRIPAWETPNLSGEPVTPKLQNVLLSKEWVEDKRSRWGEDDPRWSSKIAAEFPLESGMTVVRLADVQAAQRGEELMTGGVRWAASVQLGVDIAASADGDETTIYERRGAMVTRRWSVQSGEPEDVTDLILQAARESGATLIHVDATGVGFGFLSEVRRSLPGVAVMPFVAAAQAKDRVQFENRRAEAHWTIRERLRRRELDLSQMDKADETLGQLLSVRYRIKKGKIIVESKDDIRKRLGRSPDDSDALLLAILPPEGSGVPATATVRAATSQRARDAAAERQAANPNAAPVVSNVPRAVPERIVPASRGARLGRVRTLRAII
jgi:hypothetical protein